MQYPSIHRIKELWYKYIVVHFHWFVRFVESSYAVALLWTIVILLTIILWIL